MEQAAVTDQEVNPKFLSNEQEILPSIGQNNPVFVKRTGKAPV
ncbi:hypothetical protein [Paenibacillus antri]|nr:hypothetical protein [Paenibacillus antri]